MGSGLWILLPILKSAVKSAKEELYFQQPTEISFMYKAWFMQQQIYAAVIFPS